jgi:hypothetical protein
LVVSRRPSVFVLALTVGDYLLWNWSLSANHDALALISGLTLPPLALVSLWIIALGAMRLLATLAQRPGTSRTPARGAGRPASPAAQGPRGATTPAGEPPGAASVQEESSRVAA